MGQISFDPFDYRDNLSEAKAARDRRYRELRAKGYTAHRWTLRNQLSKYRGLGQPDGRVRDIYMLDFREPDNLRKE